MAGIIYSPKVIYDQDFKKTMRGYDPTEVDEFLDNVIKDYETYAAQIKTLKKEIESLKEQLNEKEESLVHTGSSPYLSPASASPFAETGPVAPTATNFDILKRISRLEREVFGKKIVE